MIDRKPKWILGKIIFSAVFLALTLRFFVIGIYKVPTSSMLPNLYVGDIIMAWKFPFNRIGGLAYDVLAGSKLNISRGSMIVFRHPKNHSFYVKRLIGLPGDKISFTENGLSINDEAFSYLGVKGQKDYVGHEHYKQYLEESDYYKINILRRTSQKEQELYEKDFVVPLNSYFVLGDNRDSSDDSRDWGVVPVENVEGVVEKVILSFDWQSPEGKKLRWGRSWLSIPRK